MSHKPGVVPPGGVSPEVAPTISTVERSPGQSQGEGAGQQAAVAEPLY